MAPPWVTDAYFEAAYQKGYHGRWVLQRGKYGQEERVHETPAARRGKAGVRSVSEVVGHCRAMERIAGVTWPVRGHFEPLYGEVKLAW